MILMDTTNKPTKLNTIQFRTTALLFSGIDCLETEIHALSLRSATLTTPHELHIQAGDIYRLNIPIKGTRAIAMSVQVTSTEQDTFEVKWTQIDMESFAILKRAIELNSNQQNQVRNDIKNLVNSEQPA